MTFKTERLLVNHFVSQLTACNTPWGEVRFVREFDYARGRTDVVVLHESGELIAFEAKLNDWRHALHQAYRNTCFAHQSFVLMPKHTALEAAAFRHDFEARGVGLCYVDAEGLHVLTDALPTSPLEPWLARAATLRVQKQA